MKPFKSYKGMLLAVVTAGWCFAAQAQQTLPGADVESLIAYAREKNPEYAAMRYEADAAFERVQPAGALPDPMLRTELQNITNFGTDGSTSLLPNRVGSTTCVVRSAIISTR